MIRNLEELTAVLSRLNLEYQAARSVLETHGPTNWAALLRDYRTAPQHQAAVKQGLGAVREAIQRGDEPEQVVKTLAEAIDAIVPLYPSTLDHSN